MENKKILITGGAGFIGSNLVLALQERYPNNEYFIVDNFLSGNFRNLIGYKGDIIVGDVCQVDFTHYFPKGIDVIFHLAAITDTILKDEGEIIFKNVEGFRNILNFTIKAKAHLIYASSAAVYGQSLLMRVGEGEKPVNAYGSSKLVMDNIARKYFDNYKDNTIIGLRYFNVYGPKENFKGKMASMVWQLCSQMKEGKRPKLFFDGEQKRDQVYIKDVIEATILALRPEKSGIFNIGAGRAVSFNEMIKILNELLGKNLEPEYFENPYKNSFQNFTQADLKQTREILGYEPKYDLRKGIEDYLESFKKL